MAKKTSTKSPEKNPNRWEGTLPSVYTTLLDGFHAKNHVKTFVDRLGIKVDIPEQIANICIGSFTPDVFAVDHDFWSTPVTREVLEANPSAYQALMDPDIVQLQGDNGHKIDTDNPTLEDMARVMQTQYLAFHARMAEMTNNDLLSRLENLRDPKFFDSLKKSAVVRTHGLEGQLPKRMPDFKVDKDKFKFSVKKVETALGKAYGRSGRPKSYDDFIRIENQVKPKARHGVFAVSDVQRMSLSVHSRDKSADQIHADYMGVRNILLVALYSGELGAHVGADDITDRVNYPSKERPSRQYPSLVAKGKICHAGPDGSYLECPMELQVNVLSPNIIEDTHRLYELSRSPGIDPDDKKDMDALRLQMQSRALAPHVQEARKRYMEDRQLPSEAQDRVARALLFKRNMGMTEHAKRHAVNVALDEFPELARKARHTGVKANGVSATRLNPFKYRLSPDVSRTLTMMIGEHVPLVRSNAESITDPIMQGVAIQGAPVEVLEFRQ